MHLRQRNRPHPFLPRNLISSCPRLCFPANGLTFFCYRVSSVLRLGASTTLPRHSSEEPGRAGVEDAEATKRSVEALEVRATNYIAFEIDTPIHARTFSVTRSASASASERDPEARVEARVS
jgi:hypothetical protein